MCTPHRASFVGDGEPIHVTTAHFAGVPLERLVRAVRSLPPTVGIAILKRLRCEGWANLVGIGRLARFRQSPPGRIQWKIIGIKAIGRRHYIHRLRSQKSEIRSEEERSRSDAF